MSIHQGNSDNNTYSFKDQLLLSKRGDEPVECIPTKVILSNEWEIYIKSALSLVAKQLCDKHKHRETWKADFVNTMTFLCQVTLVDVVQNNNNNNNNVNSAAKNKGI